MVRVGDLDMSAVDARPGVVHVTVRGELDLVHAVAFDRRLLDVEADRPELLVVDLREVTFVDSVGLAQLISAHRRAQRDRRRVVWVGGSAPIDQVLRVTHLGNFLDVVSDPP